MLKETMQRVGVWALAVGCLAGCKPQSGRTDQVRTAATTAEPQGAEPKDTAPAAVGGNASQRLVALLAQHPEPYLSMRLRDTASSLRLPLGKPVSFLPAVPGVQRWKDLNVGRFAVRYAGGRQETIPTDRPGPTGLVTYTFAAAGPAMLMFCAGSKDEPKSDDWQRVSHCTKMIVNVSDGGSAVDENAGSDFTGETGLPIDVVPFTPPIGLVVGSEMAASFHLLNEELGHFEVAARRPDGSIDRQVTDKAGIAHFQLSQPGRWVIRLVKYEAEGERVGELVFEVGEGKR